MEVTLISAHPCSRMPCFYRCPDVWKRLLLERHLRYLRHLWYI